jgi:phosphatidylserine decarboxylase
LSSLIDKLFVAVQRLLPTRLLGRVIYRLTRSRRVWLKNGLIRGFMKLYAIDVDEMSHSSAFEYPSFNAFFTRTLKPGSRPFDEAPSSLCCPADGKIQQYGDIKRGQMLQAKGFYFSAQNLLGISAAEAAAFDGGTFMTVYLAPHNYHRVHAPLPGTVRRMIYIPGKRFAVNRSTARTVPGLFAVNERVACYCENASSPYWLVFVGAMNVASISTEWAGEIQPGATLRSTTYPDNEIPALTKGAGFGHFNMGSTVIILFPPGRVTWEPSLGVGNSVVVGQKIGQL